MKLNLHILSDVLQKWNFQGNITETYDIRKCTYPFLCTNTPLSFQENILYLLNHDVLPASPPDNVCPSILCLGKPSNNWLSANINLLYSEEELSLEQLLNEISYQFFRYQNWESSLQEVLDQKLSFQELANRTDGIIYNPFYAMGSSLHIICGNLPSPQEETMEYQKYKESFSITAGYLIDVEDSIDYIPDAEYKKMTKNSEPEINTDTAFGANVLYYNIFIDHVSVAMICIDELLTPLTKRDYALIKIWGSYIEKKLKSDGIFPLNHSEEIGKILLDLVNHTLLPEKKIKLFLDDYHWNMYDDYLCIVMQHKVQDAPTALEQLAISLSNLLSHDCYVIKDQKIIFLFNLTHMRATAENIYHRLLPLLRDRLLSAGISLNFYDFKNLYYYYKQALEVMEIGEKKEPEKWYYRFEDYQIDYLLTKYQSKTISETLIPTGLKRLIYYDKNKNSNYVETLRIYLDNERNVAETIRTMYVHRNTFTYRIERIEKILGMDLNSANNRIILQLALRILENQKIQSEPRI